ncbi:cytochrome P450 family protein [Streptacidiphilus anmyonensis]|uniref:cytochrome P450 family protein n=1 Tax=Streptacidiphilus anmyonensis TaxID=405782 RepID=UPI0005A6B682|nr:cytochrome P450 [Streptacidiphilus anmyonensis]
MDINSPDFLRDPYPTLARLRSNCPVQPLTDRKGRTSYLVLGYAEARQALADPRLSKDTSAFFASRPSGRTLHPALSRTMLATDPPDHTRLRRLATSAFTTGAVARLRPAISRITSDLLDQWPVDGEVDAVETLAVPLPVTVICEMLGVPGEDRGKVRAWSLALFAAGNPADTDAASHELAAYLARLIDAKRTVPGDSLLDALIAARDEADRLTESELVSLAALLLMAGHETTTSFLGNALLALLDHPAELDRLRARPELLPDSLDELLRFDSPVAQATFRYTTEDVDLGGTVVPAGSPVLVSPGAANRDPLRFPEPDDLDLGRDASGHLSFGHGIHRCLGAPLARAEAEIALGQLITRFPDMRVAVPRDQLAWRPTRLVRALVTLPLTLGNAPTIRRRRAEV